MQLFLLALLFAIVFSAEISAKHRTAFNIWKSKYNKSYSTEEHETRLNNFVSSIERVQKRKDQVLLRGKGANYGLTKFADLSPEEFRSTILMKKKIHPRKEKSRVGNKKKLASIMNNLMAPSTFDWRSQNMVTPVKDQEQCGSCWAFSATETIESAWMLKHNLTSKNMTPLSPQQIVDCDEYMMGCGGGQSTSALNYVMSAGGLETIYSYPYEGQNGQCQFVQSEVYASIKTWEYACSIENEKELIASTYQYGPTSICVDASNWQDYTSGIMTAWECAYINLLDHCVQAVGWNTNPSQNYWSVRNSWNTDWGENGYIRLEYGANTCGLTYDATYVISA